MTLRELPPKNQKRCDFSDDCVNPNMIERVLRVRIVLGSRDRVFSGVGIGLGKQTLFGKSCHVSMCVDIYKSHLRSLFGPSLLCDSLPGLIFEGWRGALGDA